MAPCPELNCSPEVHISCSRCVEPGLIFAQGLAEVVSPWISQSGKLHQTEWANVLFHDLHSENKSLLVGICINKLQERGSSVGRELRMHYDACECLITTVSAWGFGVCMFWMAGNFTFCIGILWLGCVKWNLNTQEIWAHENVLTDQNKPHFICVPPAWLEINFLAH